MKTITDTTKHLTVHKFQGVNSTKKTKIERVKFFNQCTKQNPHILEIPSYIVQQTKSTFWKIVSYCCAVISPIFPYILR